MNWLITAMLLTAFMLCSGCQNIPFVDTPGLNFRLADAAGGGNVKMVKKLVEEGADVNSRPSMNKENVPGSATILMRAAYAGGAGYPFSETERLEVIKYLLDHGANPWLTESNGDGVVDYAYYSKSLKIVAYMKEYMKAHPKESVK